MIEHACNPRTEGLEADESGVQGQCQLYSKFKASQSQMSLFLKSTKQTKQPPPLP